MNNSIQKAIRNDCLSTMLTTEKYTFTTIP